MSTTNIEANQVTINGVQYVRADSVSAAVPSGNRAIIVADRGWIFAGDVERSGGRIILTRAVHVRSWQSIGFDGLIDSNGRGPSVVVKKLSKPVDMPEDAELFSIPVADEWGL